MGKCPILGLLLPAAALAVEIPEAAIVSAVRASCKCYRELPASSNMCKRFDLDEL